jgi:hypothetical protein
MLISSSHRIKYKILITLCYHFYVSYHKNFFNILLLTTVTPAENEIGKYDNSHV